jgi:hypothetical protein
MIKMTYDPKAGALDAFCPQCKTHYSHVQVFQAPNVMWKPPGP